MKSLKIAAVLFASTALAGCSLLYPHWGATTFPTDGPSNSSSASASAQPSSTASASASPTATTVPIQKAIVNILQSSVNATGGVVDVVAQITNVAEAGGQCTLSATVAGVTKTQTVRAESNVDTTQCFPMEVSIAGLSTTSTVSVTVTYKSAGYIGSSSMVVAP